jgi:hypothetical protein
VKQRLELLRGQVATLPGGPKTGARSPYGG